MEAFETFSSKVRGFQAYAFTYERTRDTQAKTIETRKR